jgi:hypothetical protein
VLGLVLCVAGCRQFQGYRTPDGIERWQDTSPPQLSLREKARAYQGRVETRHLTPEGMVRYKRIEAQTEAEYGYGDLADGPFFQGMYLASQSLRYAATGNSEARRQLLRSLDGMELLAEVSGKRGLLARYVSTVKPPRGERWLASSTRPGLFWRSDASKDQYAGFVHGLGVTLAVVSEPEIRARVAALAAAIADHVIEHDLEIVDWDGDRTTYGDLRGRQFGLPIGVNALIALAIAEAAAVANDAPRYRDFYERLVREGYADTAYWAHVSLLGIGKRTNDNMAYLALYPLLLLEEDAAVARVLRRGAARSWKHVGEDRNALFAFIHAAVGVDPRDASDAADGVRAEARARGRASLFEFPDEKIAWPVDLTRDGFDFPQRFLKGKHGRPRAKSAVPPYLRVRSSSLWASDPFRLVGRFEQRGDIEYVGIDYLVAYWMGRHHGFIAPEE